MSRPTGITPRQIKFVQNYVITGNATQALIDAGYKTKTPAQQAHALLSKDYIQAEVRKNRDFQYSRQVATGMEVLDFLTRVMRGEVKDQFGLETSVADRIKAAQELAKRTIDIDNRTKGSEPVVEIKLDWGRENCIPVDNLENCIPVYSLEDCIQS